MEVTVDITGAQNSSSLEQLPSGLLIKFRPRGHGEAVSSCIPCCQEQINYRTVTEFLATVYDIRHKKLSLKAVRRVAISYMSCLELHLASFRLLMKRILDALYCDLLNYRIVASRSTSRLVTPRCY